MADIAYPSTDLFRPESMDFGIRSSVQMTTSSHTGAIQRIDMLGSRFVASLGYGANQSADNRAQIEAFWAQVEGQVNNVLLFHMRRQVPRGTISGTLTIYSVGTPAGYNTITLQGATPGQTLLAGDMLKLGNQLVMVTADSSVDANGRCLFSFSPRLRAATPAGTSVTYTRPTAKFMVTAPEVRVSYAAYGVEGFTVDLMEVF